MFREVSRELKASIMASTSVSSLSIVCAIHHTPYLVYLCKHCVAWAASRLSNQGKHEGPSSGGAYSGEITLVPLVIHLLPKTKVGSGSLPLSGSRHMKGGEVSPKDFRTPKLTLAGLEWDSSFADAELAPQISS